jgi:hypothetical protein
MLTFRDNTLIGTTALKNCFDVDGGELNIVNLKLKFNNNGERMISNLVTFSEIGGNLHVKQTTIEHITVGGGKPLFGDEFASMIYLTNCKFN